MLHLQLGQEVIYLVMAAALFAALILAILAAHLSTTLARDRPPIITLEETQGYSFASGSAALSARFQSKLTEVIVPKIVARSAAFNAPIVEVIGHTDQRPVGPSAVSTMDNDLLLFFNGEAPAPTASDNAGLGMARAAAVARALRNDPRTRNLTILPYSAGQAVTPEERLARADDGPLDDQSRRRIEIRLRRPAPIEAGEG